MRDIKNFSIFTFEDLWQEYLLTSQFSDLRMTTVKLKPDELAAFKEAFDMFDKKGDGSISTKVGPASTKMGAYQQRWARLQWQRRERISG